GQEEGEARKTDLGRRPEIGAVSYEAVLVHRKGLQIDTRGPAQKVVGDGAERPVADAVEWALADRESGCFPELLSPRPLAGTVGTAADEDRLRPADHFPTKCRTREQE